MLVLLMSSAAGFTLARFPVLLLPKRIIWHPALESGSLVTEFLVIARNGAWVFPVGVFPAFNRLAVNAGHSRFHQYGHLVCVVLRLELARGEGRGARRGAPASSGRARLTLPA